MSVKELDLTDFEDYSTEVVFASDTEYRRFGRPDKSKQLKVITKYCPISSELSVIYRVYKNRELVETITGLQSAIKRYNEL